ncbi:MAG: DnaD domain protein [Clostridia bacterium]|nr:DnaD domain protein [Clostridia bacterium]
MKIKINYEDGIINVPSEAVLSDLGAMEADELRVLLYICAEPSFRHDTDAGKAHAIKTLDMQWAAIEAAIGSLAGRGVISSDEVSAEGDVRPKAKKQKASVRADSPVYTKDETAGIIDRNADLRKIINDDVPRLTGKAVTQNEAIMLVSMYDYLRLSAESIIKLVDFCRTNGAVSFRVVERTAYSLFDNDITSPEAIDEFIIAERRKEEITEHIRQLFGIGKRALIAHEKTLIKTWVENFGYGADMIDLAYEVTIKAINEPSLDYAGAVMKRWHETGYRTPEDVESGEAQPAVKPAAGKKGGKKVKAESFDADEFMNLSLQRSYKE